MMKKLPLFVFCTIMPLAAHAQDYDLTSSLMGVDEIGLKKETTSENTNEQVADDRGSFSFLNLSFIKKPLNFFSSDSEEQETPTSPDQPQKEETPLQKTDRLARSGDVDAALSLGYMYLYGENGVESNPEKAFEYYEMAAAQNDKIALNNLGSLYFNGIGTKVNYKKAAELFAKAAQAGSDDSAVNLAFIYLSGDSQYKNLDEVINLLTQASNAGNKTAKFMLGYAYLKGFRLPRDYNTAFKLIKEAADAGFDEAQHILANMYLNGQGVAKNYGNSVKYFRSAITQGYVPSMIALADILATGSVYPKNIAQAHILYNVASVYNAQNAAYNRDQLEKALKIEELLQAQTAAENFKESPSELTSYIRQTFGSNITRYIDINSKIK